MKRASWPPEKVKRKAIPLRVKLEAALILLGLDPKTTEFHHDPPIEMRPTNRMKGKALDTVPPQLDPRFITPLSKADHKVRTHGNKSDPLSGDLAKIRKTKRIAEKYAHGQTAFTAAKPPPWRSWPKGRKIPKRRKSKWTIAPQSKTFKRPKRRLAPSKRS